MKSMTRAELDEARRAILNPAPQTVEPEASSSSLVSLDPQVLRVMQETLHQVASLASSVDRTAQAIAALPQPAPVKPAKQLEADVVRDGEGRMTRVIVTVVR